MVSAANDRKVWVMQRVITIACFVIGFGSVGTVGMYSVGRQGGSDIYGRYEAGDSERIERAYIADVLAMFGNIDIDNAFSNITIVDTIVNVVSVVDIAAIVEPNEPIDEIVAAPVVPARGLAAGRNTAVKPPTLSVVDSAQIALRAGDYGRVFALLRRVPRSNDVVYLRAQATLGQFRSGEASGQDVVAIWTDVKNRNAVGSRRYSEADSVLALFLR